MRDPSEQVLSWIQAYYDIKCRLDLVFANVGFQRRYYSQKAQDRWILSAVFPGRTAGYFVEVGVGNGLTESNTYALERDYGWNGVLIEANPRYAASIRRLRRAVCVNSCVDVHVGSVEFLCNGYTGGIVAEDTDNCSRVRGRLLRTNKTSISRMSTTTLGAVLDEVRAPHEIEYLSLDVEGAELRVLQGMPFDRYSVMAMTVERPTRAIHDLLGTNGFVLAKRHLCDGFYLSKPVAARLRIGVARFAEPRPRWF